MENQVIDPNSEFRFRNEVLVAAVEEMKSHPPAALIEFKESHPEHKNTKGVSCALLADFFRLGESTLRKLKTGQISNPVCITLYNLWLFGGLDPLALLGIPHAKECNEKQCTADMRVAQQKLDAKDAHIADLERQLEKNRPKPQSCAGVC